MQAIEKRSDVATVAKAWRRAFAEGAEVIGTMGSQPVLWHERLRIWGLFGHTDGKEATGRDWNAFGQQPRGFRDNIVVEINQPPSGKDTNLQAIFAVDDRGRRWLLHQGRMSVAGSRITEADFIAATGLTPTKVRFSDGSSTQYHKVADLQSPPAAVQASVATFVARCASARLAKIAGKHTVDDGTAVERWEHNLSPEQTGDYDVAPRGGTVGRRIHGEVWRALATELERRDVPHSNDRVGQHGPDMFTYGNGPRVLFEIKSGHGAQDIFAAVGQLQIYERLLKSTYRKVLIVPRGMGPALQGPVSDLGISTVEFYRKGQKTHFDTAALDRCLG
ncbi:hypothetical protein QCD71_10660 [Sphingomonas sp. PsM26]|nr:hypothetical protein [Sphingomonas sp. PsM26]